MPLSSHELPLLPDEMWEGDRTLLTWPTAAVLNSRQSRYPVGADPWVRSTIEAATWVAREGTALISGAGLATWEMGLWAAGEALGGVIVLAGVPGNAPSSAVEKQLQELLRDFTLSHQSVLVLPYRESARSPKGLWQVRDRWIMEHAKLLLPVSIRPGGFFESTLRRNDLAQKVDARFLTDYAPRRNVFPRRPHVDIVRARLRPDDWLGWAIHWTRTQHGPWPGERARSFYRDLAASGNSYPRDALATLNRILEEQIVRGSRRHMPLQKAMIGFTELHPADALELMRWRRRYVEFSYEPYGVAVRTAALLQRGARIVRYGTPEERKALPVSERPFFQTVSSKKADWRAEREIRLEGDLDLSALNPEDVRIIIRSEAERARVSKSPWPLVVLSGGVDTAAGAD